MGAEVGVDEVGVDVDLLPEGPVHHEDSARGRLMNAAIGLFARKGYAATTVREIVESARVTKPVLYYHFGSKEGIYLAMMRETLVEFVATMEEALKAGGTVAKRTMRFLDVAVALMAEHLDVMRVVEAIYYGPPQGAPFFDFEVIHRRFMDMLTGLVREGMASGEFRMGDPEDVAWAIVGTFEVVRGMTLCHPEMGFGRERLERLVRVVFDGVLANSAEESVR